MKTEIRVKPQAKVFEPFDIVISVQTVQDLDDIGHVFGCSNYISAYCDHPQPSRITEVARRIYDSFKDRLNP